MRTAEIAPFCFLAETVAEADERENEGDMDVGDEREQAGIAAEIALELMEGTEAFLGLGDKLWVALEGAEAHGIVDMADGDAMLAERLAQEHILVAITAEALIEGVGEHEIATDEEIGCMEMLIR